MKRYVLDANLYIEAIRSRRAAAALHEFTFAFAPSLYMHAVVAQELLAGSANRRARRSVERDLILPFEKRGRVITPTYRSWKRSGEIVAALVERKRLARRGIPHSFMNDALLAASCREEGVVVVTRNDRDFSRIALVEPLSYMGPWPMDVGT